MHGVFCDGVLCDGVLCDGVLCDGVFCDGVLCDRELLVVVVDKTPPLPQEGRTTRSAINSRQTILSAIWVLSLQKLNFDTYVATIDTAEV